MMKSGSRISSSAMSPLITVVTNDFAQLRRRYTFKLPAIGGNFPSPGGTVGNLRTPEL